jgi:hypothetical protein
MSAQPQMEAFAPPSTRKFRFAWLLPLGQLVLCAALLWPVRLIILRELHIPVPRIIGQTMLPDYVRWSYQQEFFLSSVAALNLPAGLVQLPYAMFNTTKRDWMPAEMDFRIWRAVTWPLLCVPFWWIAGRAIDALTRLKHRLVTPIIGWTETIIGFVLMAACGTGFFGLLFGLPKEDRTLELTRFVAGCGLWALLGGLSVVARFRQWRFNKKQKAAI